MIKRAGLEIAACLGILAAAALLLAGCGPKVVTRDRPVSVSMPVSQPCAGPRPPAVPILRERFPDPAWAAMDLRQKAAAVGGQALELRGHGEQLAAATAACP